MLRLLNTLAQAARTANRRRLERRHAGAGLTYAEWIRRHDTLDQAVLQALQRRLAALPSRPLISVLMPVYNPEPQWLAEAIASVRQQIYPHWQLCIADDCSTDPAVRPLLQAAADSDARIRVVFRASNGHIAHASQSALDVAAGEFVALLDHDDVLPAHALLLNAEVIAHLPATRVLYSDEDVLRFDGQRQSPNFKPDWNPELMRSQNLVCHLGVYQSALVRSVGGFRPGFEGAQDYDLALRCLEQARDDQIVHIPHVLYHWRQHRGSSAAGDDVKPYISEAGRRALQQHLDRRGQAARAEAVAGGGYRVHHPLPAGSVCLVVDSEHGPEALARCLRSLLRQSVGGELQVLISVSSQTDRATLAWLDAEPADARVVPCRVGADGTAAERRNRAASKSQATWLGFVDSRVEWASDDALTELLSLAARSATGVVGAKLLASDQRLLHGGWVVGDGAARPLDFRDVGAGGHGYRSRAVLNQNLAAVGAACLVVRRQAFEAAGAFDAQYADADLAAVDLCLRTQACGLRTVWAAHAPVLLHAAAHADPARPAAAREPSPDLLRLRRRWGPALDLDPAYSPQLSLEPADFSLASSPRVSLAQPWFASAATAAAAAAAAAR